jgi:lipopolysaccharide export system protein LptC
VSRRALLTLALLLAASITGWQVWTQRGGTPVPAAASVRSDYVLQDFEVVVLDDRGQESFTVKAPRLERHPSDRTMTMPTPVFYIPAAPAKGQTPTRAAGWEVRAGQGWVSAGGDELRLLDGVVAKTVDQQTRPVVMTTEQLNVFPENNRATSPTTVTVEQPGSILRGQGMEALLDSKRVRFSSNVKVRYVPSR